MKFPSHRGSVDDGSVDDRAWTHRAARRSADADRRSLWSIRRGRFLINPATEEVVGHAPDASVADAEAAVAAARRAFDTTDWSTNTELRIRCLDQLHQALVDHRDELAELTIAEVGATPAMCAGAQLDAPIAIVRYYADLLKTYPLTEDLGNSESHGMQHHRWVEKEAAGVVAAIIAYNYPNAARTGEAGARAGGRMHRRAEGRAGYAADHACARRADRQPHRYPGRRGQRAFRYRPRSRCRADDESRRRHGHLHRLDPDRPGDHGRGQRDVQDGLPRTRREVGRDRARRRRLRHGGALHRVRDGQPLRSGLCDHDTDAGAEQAPRRDRREVEEQLRRGALRQPRPTRAPTWVR